MVQKWKPKPLSDPLITSQTTMSSAAAQDWTSCLHEGKQAILWRWHRDQQRRLAFFHTCVDCQCYVSLWNNFLCITTQSVMSHIRRTPAHIARPLPTHDNSVKLWFIFIVTLGTGARKTYLTYNNCNPNKNITYESHSCYIDDLFCLWRRCFTLLEFL